MKMAAEKLPKDFFTVDQGEAVNFPVVFRVLATKVLVLQLLTLTVLIDKIWI
jgi:hypothetical protein